NYAHAVVASRLLVGRRPTLIMDRTMILGDRRKRKSYTRHGRAKTVRGDNRYDNRCLQPGPDSVYRHDLPVHGGAARLDRGGHVAVSRRRVSRGDVCAVQGGGTGGRRPLRYVGASGIAADARGAVARLSVRRWVPRDLHAQTN